MEPIEDRLLSRRLRLVQWLRWLLKATIWHGLTALLDRAGLTLRTVQVLCVDRESDLLLLLRAREYPCGYCPVQGLRTGALSFGLISPRVDVRDDARRELLEEALLEAPPLAEFRVAERYREGRFAQFDCTVLVVPCNSQQLPLRARTGEGTPVWLPLAEALDTLGNPVLRDTLADWLDDPDTGEEAAHRRFLFGPPEVVRPMLDAPEPPATESLQQLWPMALRMLDTARQLGRRDAAEVYQANPAFATELWHGMSTAARDCYRPDPRLWRDCRLLHAERIADLLPGWWDARLEAVSERHRDGNARSIPGKATPSAALALQQRSGCGFSLDLIYDSEEDRVACFLTRAGLGGVVSDVLLYALISSRYLPIPVFHTNPNFRSPLGYKQPLVADFWRMRLLYHQLNGSPVGEAVFFPDGTCTEYGISGHGYCCFRRAGDPLLPAIGELATTFMTLALPERPQRDASGVADSPKKSS
jgi:hypothetical protein